MAAAAPWSTHFFYLFFNKGGVKGGAGGRRRPPPPFPSADTGGSGEAKPHLETEGVGGGGAPPATLKRFSQKNKKF